VSTAGFTGKVSLEIYDLQGRVVYSEVIANAQGSERAVVDVSDLDNGTYVVRMSSSVKALASKLVVRR
jgi:hypothetical protein